MQGPNPNMILNAMLQRNPGLMNNPQAAQVIQVLQSGDARAGQQLAQQLCQQYGVSPQQVIQQAKGTFGF